MQRYALSQYPRYAAPVLIPRAFPHMSKITPCAKIIRISALFYLFFFCFSCTCFLPTLSGVAKGITADEIIASAIQRRSKTYSDLQNYSYTAYAKKVSFSEQKGKPSRISRIMEYWINGLWKKPDYLPDVITAFRVFGKSDINWDIGIMHDSFGDQIDIETCSVVHPLAKDALHHYKYVLKGLVTSQESEVYEITFTPINPDTPALEGTLWIEPESFLSVAYDITFNKAAILPLFTNRLRIIGKKSLYLNKYSLANHQRQEVEFGIWKWFKGTAKKEIMFSNIKVNSDSAQEIPDEKKATSAPYITGKDSLFWLSHSLLPNTAEEDSALKNLPQGSFYPVIFAVNFANLISSYQRTAQNYVFNKDKHTYANPTSLNDFFRHNRVEGVHLGVGFTHVITKRADIFWRTGYGFGDKQWKYKIGGRIKVRKTRFGISLYHELGFKEDPEIVGTGGNTITSLFGRNDRMNYFSTKGVAIYNEWSISDAKLARLTYLDEIEESVRTTLHVGPAITKRPFRDNPSVIPGIMRSIQFDFRHTTPNRFNVHSDGWDIKTHGEISNHRILRSDFVFSIIGIKASRFQKITARSLGIVNLEAQTSIHGLPPQRLFEFGGTSFLYPVGRLRGPSYNEFGGDKYIKLTAEYRDGGALLQKMGVPIPQLRLLQTIFFFGGAYSDISYQTKAKLLEKTPEMAKPYLEVGFAVADIYHIARIDFIWKTQTPTQTGFFLIRFRTFR